MGWFVATSLSKSYDDIIALDNLNFDISKGKIIGLIGPNGSGKSTLLRIGYGLIRPTAGRLKIFSYDSWKDQNILRNTIGYIPETFYLPNTYVKDLMMLTKEYTKEAIDPYQELNIDTLHEKHIYNLSAGQKQLLKIAFTLSRKYRLILMDEPLKELDIKNRLNVVKLIVKLSREYNTRFIISSHILGELEEFIDYLIIIDGGKLVYHGDSKDILQHRYIIKCSDTGTVLSTLRKKDIDVWREGTRIVIRYKDNLEDLVKLLDNLNLLKYIISIDRPKISSIFKEVIGD